MSTNYEEIKRTKKELRDYLEENGDNWKFDEESLAIFDEFFSTVTGGMSIQDMVDRFRQSGREPIVVNFFGGTKVLEDLGVVKGTSVRLENKKDDEKYDVISGDLISKKIWDDIPDNIDIALSMPRGGLYHIPDSPDVAYFLLNNVWNKLNPESGIFLFQALFFNADQFLLWADQFNGVDGVRIFYNVVEDVNDTDKYIAVGLYRLPGAPQDLPKIK